MGRLALIFPWLARFDSLPLSRDQLILLMAAVNEIFLGIDIFLAHSISGTIVPNEWIPIIFGPTAGLLLLGIGLLAQRNRQRANLLASTLFLFSIAVGLLGAYFHVRRGILPTGPPGEWVSIELLVWAPPVIGPLTFALVGLMGISAAWKEDPVGSGVLSLGGNLRVHLPYSKTRALFFMVGLGTLASLISMVFDHARAGFINPWLWISAGVAVFGTAVAVGLGATEDANESDYRIFAVAMVGLIALGLTGLSLHVNENLIAEGKIVTERFVRGAPFLAPMLFADMGALGLISLLDPK
jgi:hypothetical protein